MIGREEEREAFIVGVGAETEFGFCVSLFFGFGCGRRGLGWVGKESADAARVGGEGVEVVFFEVER